MWINNDRLELALEGGCGVFDGCRGIRQSWGDCVVDLFLLDHNNLCLFPFKSVNVNSKSLDKLMRENCMKKVTT